MIIISNDNINTTHTMYSKHTILIESERKYTPQNKIKLKYSKYYTIEFFKSLAMKKNGVHSN